MAKIISLTYTEYLTIDLTKLGMFAKDVSLSGLKKEFGVSFTFLRATTEQVGISKSKAEKALHLQIPVDPKNKKRAEEIRNILLKRYKKSPAKSSKK